MDFGPISGHLFFLHLLSFLHKCDFPYMQGIIGEDFCLHGGMDTGMREQEGVEVTEVAEVMVVEILIAGLNLEIGITIGEEWQTVEVRDIRGLKMVDV